MGARRNFSTGGNQKPLNRWVFQRAEEKFDQFVVRQKRQRTFFRFFLRQFRLNWRPVFKGEKVGVFRRKAA